MTIVEKRNTKIYNSISDRSGTFQSYDYYYFVLLLEVTLAVTR